MKFQVTKRIEVAAAHRLKLDYPSKCQLMHGHNWIIHVTCENDRLNQNGMVIDFAEIKEVVNKLDHSCINDVMDQPTAENIASYLMVRIPFCVRIQIQESEGNVCIVSR